MKVARSIHLIRPIDINPDSNFVGPPLFTDLINIRYSSGSDERSIEISCEGENAVAIVVGNLMGRSINVSWEQWIDIRREVNAVFSDMNRLKNTNKWFICKPTEGTHEWGVGSCPICGYRLIKVKKTGFLFCSNHEAVCDYERNRTKEVAL